MDVNDILTTEKQQLIETILRESATKNKKELIPFFLAASMQAAKRGIVFTEEETKQLLSSLKEGRTPEEQNRLDMMAKMASGIADRQFH